VGSVWEVHGGVLANKKGPHSEGGSNRNHGHESKEGGELGRVGARVRGCLNETPTGRRHCDVFGLQNGQESQEGLMRHGGPFTQFRGNRGSLKGDSII